MKSWGYFFTAPHIIGFSGLNINFSFSCISVESYRDTNKIECIGRCLSTNDVQDPGSAIHGQHLWNGLGRIQRFTWCWFAGFKKLVILRLTSTAARSLNSAPKKR